ncbi:unnamed protein product [Notodromas monacha]|uniref:Uncharacterized protein n=1 Tax=Notodromas monacha TaxID=399045 RepID=A0A7R9GIU4_9CRUS|nr:unnamed protein product [Notodromas monacha]CAG0922820.1 unnamed protein product [Notodromas monacha]
MEPRSNLNRAASETSKRSSRSVITGDGGSNAALSVSPAPGDEDAPSSRAPREQKVLKRPPMNYTSNLVLRRSRTKCKNAEPPKVIKLDDFCDPSGCVSVTFELCIKDDGNLQVKLISKETEHGKIDNISDSVDDEEAATIATDTFPREIPVREFFTDPSIHSKVTEQINSSGIEIAAGIDPHHHHYSHDGVSKSSGSASPSPGLSVTAQDGEDLKLLSEFDDIKRELLNIPDVEVIRGGNDGRAVDDDDDEDFFD